MTLSTRRLFFYCSIILFVIAGPLLIAYSLGYIFRLDTGELETTGGIFIKSKTPRLSLFLDNTFIKETSYLSGGALLTDITPGHHHLRIEKESYHPWSGIILVEPTTVTDLRNILLVANPPAIATSTQAEISLIQASKKIPSSALVAPKESVSLPALSASARSSSFFLDNNQNLIEKTSTTTIRVIPHINSFGTIGDTVYFIDKNGFLGMFDVPTKTITTIGRPGFYLSETMAQFSISPNATLIILDASGGLFLSDGISIIKTITGGVRQFSLDASGQKLLVRKDQEIDVIWLDDNTFQPFQKQGTQDKIYTDDTNIQDADWFFGDNAHILIRTKNSIFFTDIDARMSKNIMTIFDKKTDEVVTIPNAPQSVFFRRGKIFYTVSIL